MSAWAGEGLISRLATIALDGRSRVLPRAPDTLGFEAGISWRVVEAKWDGIREAFHGFDPAQVAQMPPAEIAAVENDSRVIRNKAKIRATVENARKVLAILDETGVWRLLTSAAGDISR